MAAAPARPDAVMLLPVSTALHHALRTMQYPCCSVDRYGASLSSCPKARDTPRPSSERTRTALSSPSSCCSGELAAAAGCAGSVPGATGRARGAAAGARGTVAAGASFRFATPPPRCVGFCCDGLRCGWRGCAARDGPALPPAAARSDSHSSASSLVRKLLWSAPCAWRMACRPG
eukprot:362961-Chlamydomonas_euryale.AAC.8